MEKLDNQHKRILLSYSDDIDVLNFCLSSKYNNDIVCNENFWKNRFLSKYGQFDKGDMSWKKFYLNIIRVKDKALRNRKSVLYYAVKTKNMEVLDFFIKNKTYTSKDYADGFLEAAAEINNRELIEGFLKMPETMNDLNLYHYRLRENVIAIIKGAIKGGHFDIVRDYFKDTRVLNESEIVGIIDYAMKNKQNDIAMYIYENINYNNVTNIINKQHVTDRMLFRAVVDNNYPFIKYFLDNGGDVNVGLKAAVKDDNSYLIQYFQSIGAKFNSPIKEEEKVLSYYT